ncbi:activating transcription factor 7-interacting protein 1 isoform X2 [Lepisosteus oculatus]|uniref:activating transcription factor 7-interacting protein 1 isoform X2 n=1 Tax=Lepisosteus oculatus TaxID=7918 RepID=UPI0035F50FB3
MDVAVAEEPQKKVFRARKTMRASDRQQLESIHRTRESSPKTGDPPNFPTLTSSPSSAPAPDAATPLVNGKHPDNEAAPQGSPQRQGREASSSPSPRPLGAAGSPSLVLSLSFSPSQAEADEGPEPLNPSSPSLSPGPGDPAAALKKAEASRGPPCTAPGLSNGTSEEEEGQGQGEVVRTPSPPAGEERGDTRREAESVGGKAPSPIILLTPLEKEQIQRERESPAQVGSLKPDSEGSVSLPSRRSQNSPGSTSPGAAAPGEDGVGAEGPVAMDTEPAGSGDRPSPPAAGSKAKEPRSPEPGAAQPDSSGIVPILEKLAPAHLSSPTPPLLPSSSSSSPPPSDGAPSPLPVSDPEPSEGFLVLSEEEEGPADREAAAPGKQAGEEEEGGRAEPGEQPMDTEPDPAGSPAPRPSPPEDAEPASQRKRQLSGDGGAEGGAPAGRGKEPPKRPRLLQEEEYEAQLEVKISARDALSAKLEKAVQRIIAEQLKLVQWSMFEQSLEQLRDRVEKMDCSKRHEQSLNTLQAKYARLAKKWGAANQAREDARKTQEAASAGTPSAAPSAAYRSSTTVRTMLDSRRAEPPGQTPVPPAAGGAPQPVQIKAVAQPAAASVVNTVVTPVLSIISTAASTGPTSTSVSAPAPLGQPGGLTLKAAPLTAGVTTSVASSSTPGAAPQPISIQPLLIQLPLSVAAAPQGALVSSPAPGIELIPVSAAPVALAGGAPHAKTTPAKSAAAPVAAAAAASGLQKSGSPLAPQMAIARAALYGSAGVVGASSAPASRAALPSLAPGPDGGGTVTVVGVTSSTPSARAPGGGPGATARPDTQATNRAPDSTTRALPQAGRPSSSGAVIDLTEDDDDVQVTGVKKAPVQAQSPSSTSTSSSSSQQPLGQRAPPPPAPVAPAPTATPQTQAGTTTMHVLPTTQTTVNVLQRPQNPISCRPLAPRATSFPSQIVYTSVPMNTGAPRSLAGSTQSQGITGSNRQASPQTTGMPVRSGTQYAVSGPQLTVHHRPSQDPSSTRPAAAPPSSCPPPPLPVHPAPLPSPPPPPGRLPPEAASTSPPQKPQLKLARVQSQNGIVLSWSVTEVDRSCAAVDSYHLYAYHEEPAPAAPPSQWKKIGEVKALPLPMACTLTQFVSGSKYYFAVRARDVYGRFGPFCDPQSTDVIAAASSS